MPGIGNASAGFLASSPRRCRKNAGIGWFRQRIIRLWRGVVILLHLQNKKEAVEFLAFTKTKKISKLLRKYRF
jgi:hypothetical protein